MLIYGASGHGKVLQDVAEACSHHVTAFIDDNAGHDLLHGIPIVHGYTPTDEPLIIAIGNNSVRRKIAERLTAHYATLIHPAALLAPNVSVGEGSVVMARALIESGTAIGRHCIVNTAVSMARDCHVADYVHLSPHARLDHHVSVGEGTWICAGSTIAAHVRIGRWAVVGAGAVIRSDIPDFALVFGDNIHFQDFPRNVKTCLNDVSGTLRRAGNRWAEEKA